MRRCVFTVRPLVSIYHEFWNLTRGVSKVVSPFLNPLSARQAISDLAKHWPNRLYLGVSQEGRKSSLLERLGRPFLASS
jgi:hypothetical protein